MHQKMEFNLLFDWVVKTIPDIYSGISTPLIKNKFHKIQEIPRLPDWLAYYENSYKITHSLINLFRESHSDCVCYLELFIFYFYYSEDERRDIISKEIQYYNSLSEMNKKIYQSSVRDFYKQLKDENDKLLNENYENTSSEQALKIISNPELLFFIRVIFPCLILYGEFPISLLNKARTGDEEALENIVRTDKSILFDPAIAKYLHKLSFNEPFHFQQLINKLSKDQPTLSKS